MNSVMIKPIIVSKEQADLALVMQRAKKAKNAAELVPHLRLAYALIDCSEQRERYHPGKIFPAIIADKLLDEVSDLLQPEETLEKVIHIKYQRQREHLEDFIEDLEELKKIAIKNAPYKQIHNIQQALCQGCPKKEFLMLYDQAKETIRKRESLSEQKSRSMDLAFYSLFLSTFTAGIKSKVFTPQNIYDCLETYHFYHYLREKIKIAGGGIPILGINDQGKFSADELIYSELEKFLNLVIEKNPQQEELFAEREQLIADGQETLYQEALFAAQQRNKPYFNLLKSGFLRYSNAFGLTTGKENNENDETPAEEMEFLEKHYFAGQPQMKSVQLADPQMFQQAIEDFLASGKKR